MNSNLQDTLLVYLQSGWQADPAMRTLVHDYTKYHTVLAIVGVVVLIPLIILTVVFWMKFKKIPRASRFKWSFDKKVFFSFGFVLTFFSLFFALVVAANISTALNPIPGFTSLASNTTTSTNSESGQALNEWVQSGDKNVPPILKQKVKARISWQRPKAIICGILLVLCVVASVQIWRYLIKVRSPPKIKWSIKEIFILIVGIGSVALSLLLIIMLVANTQGAIAPLVISLLGAGG